MKKEEKETKEEREQEQAFLEQAYQKIKTKTMEDEAILKIAYQSVLKNYLTLDGLVPIYKVIEKLEKFGLDPEKIDDLLYESYIYGIIQFEMGDKKENLYKPRGSHFYYYYMKMKEV